jgi:uncharacterized protein (TIGR02145 family)
MIIIIQRGFHLLKKVCLPFLVLISAGNLYGQDIIYKNDSSVIKAKVLEITLDLIKYKNYDQQMSGPLRNIAIADVNKIIYEDGTKDIFNKKSPHISDTTHHADISANDYSYKKDSSFKKNPENNDFFIDPRDGKKYKIIEIGGQIWMAENLNYNVPNSWCNRCETYGRLYNYDEAKNACPLGWHLPSDTEWTTLTDYLGGETVAGGKLKSTSGWISPNYKATNSSGFTALPAGARGISGIFDPIGHTGYWWTSTDGNGGAGWYRFMSYYYCDVYRGGYAEQDKGFSVRCIKNQ